MRIVGSSVKLSLNNRVQSESESRVRRGGESVLQNALKPQDLSAEIHHRERSTVMAKGTYIQKMSVLTVDRKAALSSWNPCP